MLKIDIINHSYADMRISGLTVDPSPKDLALALIELEDMMAEIEVKDICIGYNFQEAPDENDPLGVHRRFHNMLHKNLAIRLHPAFNKVVHPVLQAQANQAMSSASSFVASRDTRQVNPSPRMPMGSGHRYRNRYQRYYRPENLPKNDCSNNKISIGDTNDYTTDFTGFLAGATIVTYTVKASDGLTLDSSSSTDNVVSYRITAIGGQNSTQKVMITITASDSRVEIRQEDFELSEAKDTSTTQLLSRRGFSGGFSLGFG